MTDQVLSVKIQSGEEVIWQGAAASVSSVNSQGPFDILPLHANFITIVKDQPIRVVIGSGMKDYSFHDCVIYARKNQVTVYANL